MNAVLFEYATSSSFASFMAVSLNTSSFPRGSLSTFMLALPFASCLTSLAAISFVTGTDGVPEGSATTLYLAASIVLLNSRFTNPLPATFALTPLSLYSGAASTLSDSLPMNVTLVPL